MRTTIIDRSDFDKRLQETLSLIIQRCNEEPGEPVLEAIRRQLEAISQWTSDGSSLTRAQKSRIVMGLQAHRELSHLPVEQDLVLALNNYIETDMK